MIEHKNEKRERIKQAAESAKDQRSFLIEMREQRLIVSMAEGRRLWYHLRPKKDQTDE